MNRQRRVQEFFLLAILSQGWLLQSARCDDILFQDDFIGKLSDKWKVIALKPEDYRIRNGGLEMRVQPGPWKQEMPRLDVILPFTDDEAIRVSATVTLLDKFTSEGERAGIHFFDDQGSIFQGTKERRGERMVYSPGAVEFTGEDGEENDVTKFKTNLIDESPDAGPLKILVDKSYAYFQVGPSKKDTYQNHMYSAIRTRPTGRGFGLIAFGAPAGANHWVRFEKFQVIRRR